MSPSRTPIPHHRSNSINTTTPTTIISGGTLPGRRCASSSSDMLQNKLRTLLNEADPLKDAKMAVSDLIAKYKAESPNHTYDISKYASPKKLNQEVQVRQKHNVHNILTFCVPYSYPFIRTRITMCRCSFRAHFYRHSLFHRILRATMTYFRMESTTDCC